MTNTHLILHEHAKHAQLMVYVDNVLVDNTLIYSDEGVDIVKRLAGLFGAKLEVVEYEH